MAEPIILDAAIPSKIPMIPPVILSKIDSVGTVTRYRILFHL